MQSVVPTPPEDSVEQEAVEHALRCVLTSTEFAGANRLCSFLKYVVTEALNGRGEMIRGKTIAQDVYGRRLDEDDRGLNLVKVDAGRLRRRLEQYYKNAGSEDPVRINIPQGGYAPEFSLAEAQDEANIANNKTTGSSGGLSGKLPLLVTISLIILAALAVFFMTGQTDNKQEAVIDSGERDAALRQAILAKSPTALQSINLAAQARKLIFPPLDPKRLQATYEMFERSIELDDNNYGGHAGAAQVAAMQAVLSPQGTRRQERIEAAQNHANNALQLRPEEAWTQSALAWVAFAKRDFDAANEISQRAVAIDPDDFDILDFDALIALFSGRFERALESAEPDRHKQRTGSRFVYRNAYAVTNFYLGRYDETVSFFDLAAKSGDPISQLSVIYQAAAYYLTGNKDAASELVKEFRKSWPDARPEILLTLMFSDKRFVEQVMGPFRSAGWTPTIKADDPSGQIR